MTDERSLLLEAVTEVAGIAGRVALEHYRTRLVVERKHDGSPVTVADRAAETAVRAWIETRFPADGVVGEELGELRADAPRRWIIDPIDGTKSFIRGVPMWGSLVAVCDGDDVLAGAACFPALGEMVSAAVGHGCWWNGARCSVSSVAAMSDATVLTTDHRFTATPDRRDAWEQLSDCSALARDWGDCYGYLLVATGRAEVMVDPILADWDAAALLPLITEAGGAFTDWSGRVTAFGRSAVASNHALAAASRRLLGVPYNESVQ